VGWAVSACPFIFSKHVLMDDVGMGTLHAWESFGDGAAVSQKACVGRVKLTACL